MILTVVQWRVPKEGTDRLMFSMEYVLSEVLPGEPSPAHVLLSPEIMV